MTTKTTIAASIARQLQDDGTSWSSPEGRTLADLSDSVGARCERGTGDHSHLVRYVYPDGSAIVAGESGWDIEGIVPWSWSGIDSLTS